MKIGRIINGYRIIGVNGLDFSTERAGLSKWTFAEKDGTEYFMKEFLTPTFPVPNCPGSLESINRMKINCNVFQTFHINLKNQIDSCITPNCTLVNTLDFFLVGTKYYKITAKVNIAPIDLNRISILPIDKRLYILKKLSQSIEILHRIGIVHGDLKPDNILIRRNIDGSYSPMLIDYDNCYYSGKPVERSSVPGDPTYYSPELENYILNNSTTKGSDLTQKSDIFALGIIFCQYLTGKFPFPIPKNQYASYVLNNGGVLQIPQNNLPTDIVRLVNKMLLKNPSERPNINKILDRFADIPERSIEQYGKVIINWGLKKRKE